MKTFARLAVAVLAVSPMAAYSNDSQVLQSCINAFVAENFPGQSPTIRIEETSGYMLPLQLVKSPKVKLIANRKVSGEVLATATCSATKGVVTVAPIMTVSDAR
jgi:hypothetical protein